MELEARQKQGLLIGALVGAVLGAGAAYLLVTAPADLEEDEEPKPITATELIGLTSLVASLIRRLDDLRRRT
jgi:gas vesicle protein